jgi:phosphatidylserine decarboxylase
MVSKAFKGVPPPSSSIGHWLPKDRADIKKWLATKLEQLDKNGPVTLDPSIIALQNLVATHPPLTRLSQAMFTEIPPAYVNDPTGKPQVRDFTTMLRLVNMILKEGPQWFDVTDPPTAMGLIGFPINAILDWPMGTLAGYLFFLDPQVNEKWQGILNTWGAYLKTRSSTQCLNAENGWLSTDALNILAAKGNDGKTDYTFQQLYVCNPTLPNFGFTSWDAFFTRKFNTGIRPIAYPDNKPTPDQPHPSRVIINACESTPLQFVTNVKLSDSFWIKQQPYSLVNMLDNDPLTSQFVGGSVYQAFLSALSYHCWHAPVSGKVAGIRLVSGTYYSENLNQGFMNPDGPDPNAPNNSQPYISAVATRGIIFIQADNPIIGLMAIVFVGMAEVSSCEFLVKEGDTITKGEPIGMFHFGGSSHCMVFRPSTNLQPHNFVTPPPWTDEANNLPVCSALAVVTPPSAL